MEFSSRYKVQKCIGEGSFGRIYQVYDLLKKRLYAVKVELIKEKYPQLEQEYRVYKNSQGKGFPKVYQFWPSVDLPRSMNFGGTTDVVQRGRLMVMQQLGLNLEQVFELCGRKFSDQTVAMIGYQLVNRLEHLHNRSYLHRDLKPDNFLIGDYTSCETEKEIAEKANIVYLIDMGLAFQWIDEKGAHLKYRDGRRLTGTPRYASIRTHKGIEQTRRDDLESLGYVLLYFSLSRLPWQGTKGASKVDMYRKIGLKKENIPISELCRNASKELGAFIQKARDLKFDEKPDYISFKKLLSSMYGAHGTINWNFDWISRHVLWQHLNKIRRQKRSETVNPKRAPSGKGPEQPIAGEIHRNSTQRNSALDPLVLKPARHSLIPFLQGCPERLNPAMANANQRLGLPKRNTSPIMHEMRSRNRKRPYQSVFQLGARKAQRVITIPTPNLGKLVTPSFNQVRDSIPLRWKSGSQPKRITKSLNLRQRAITIPVQSWNSKRKKPGQSNIKSRVRSKAPVIDLRLEKMQEQREDILKQPIQSQRQFINRIVISPTKSRPHKILDRLSKNSGSGKVNEEIIQSIATLCSQKSKIEISPSNKQQSQTDRNQQFNGMSFPPNETYSSPRAGNVVEPSPALNSKSRKKLSGVMVTSKVLEEQLKFSETVKLLDEIRLLKEENARVKQDCKRKEQKISMLELKQKTDDKQFTEERKKYQDIKERWRHSQEQFSQERKEFQDQHENWKNTGAKWHLELQKAREKIRKLESMQVADNSSAPGELSKIKRSSIVRRKIGKKRKRTAPLLKPAKRKVWRC